MTYDMTLILLILDNMLMGIQMDTISLFYTESQVKPKCIRFESKTPKKNNLLCYFSPLRSLSTTSKHKICFLAWFDYWHCRIIFIMWMLGNLSPNNYSETKNSLISGRVLDHKWNQISTNWVPYKKQTNTHTNKTKQI